MQSPHHEQTFIELDDPTPRWFRWGGILLAVLIAALVIAPWVIDIDRSVEADTSQPQQVRELRTRTSAPVCQPTLELPAFAEPAASVALPSWMRICDWFIEPVGQPMAWPTQPVDSPRQMD